MSREAWNDELRALLLALIQHRGKVIGTLMGLWFGWLVIRYGLFKAVLVLGCVLAGYHLGSRVDNKEDWRRIFSWLFPPR